jgi:hypothetical protein
MLRIHMIIVHVNARGIALSDMVTQCNIKSKNDNRTRT